MTALSTQAMSGEIRQLEETNPHTSADHEVRSNAEFYAPPAYTITSTEGEDSLEVEAQVAEKTPLLEENQPTERNDLPSSPDPTTDPAVREPAPSHVMPTRKPLDLTHNAAYDIKCSVLKDRPATWRVKKKRGMALCPFAAAVLVNQGILKAKHLELVPSLLQRSSFDPHNPTDPLSALFVSTYDIVGDLLLGAGGGFVEIARNMGPQFEKSEPAATLSEPQSNFEQSGALPLHWENKRSKSNAFMVGPRAVVHYGAGTVKGALKITETCIKSPMIYSHSMTRGWHNAPNLYGVQLREHGEIVDLKTGFVTAGKAFGYGTFDGVKDFFVMPVKGARKEGVLGLGKGVGKGFGNMVCNFGEASFGLLGYPLYGIYKELEKSASSGNVEVRSVVLTLGEAEFQQASEEERKVVVKRWLHVQMRRR